MVTTTRNDLHQLICRAALGRFSRNGYDATSLQDIADEVGTTKANVLYHFGSKPGLLEASVAPAIEAFEGMLDAGELAAGGGLFEGPCGGDGVFALVDFLFDHAEAVGIFVNQGSALRDHASIARATALIARATSGSGHLTASDDARLGDRNARLSIAVAGATYCIAERSAHPGLSGELDDAAFRRRITAAVRAIAAMPDEA